MQQAKTKVT